MTVTTVRLGLGATALALAGAIASPVAAQSYEIWAVDQGTHTIHIYGADLNEVGRIDLGARGVRVPHMIDFTSDYALAFVAATGSGDTTVIRTADRAILEVVKTGPRSHMAVVAPDDRTVVVDVMGDPNQKRSGRLVEIVVDRAAGKFTLGRSLTIAEDPAFKALAARFGDSAAICHDYTRDGRFAYVTLGAGLPDGGLVIVDTQRFALVKAFPPDQVKVNCGTLLTPDGKRMLVNGGDGQTGHWYAFDTATHEVVKQGSSRGLDAHGTWLRPDGKEIWMVNRVTSNGIVLDPQSLDVVAEIADTGKTPDIIAVSPDSRFAFASLRGPNPVSAPHLAKGTTPGFSVIDVATRKLVRVVQPAAGNDKSDVHGIGVRVVRN